MQRSNTKSRGRGLGIGKLSERTGVGIEAIRYYERIGLLAAPRRTDGGHRLYDEDVVAQLTFVRRSRALGFSLDEIGELLVLGGKPDFACGDARAIAERQLSAVRAKIGELRELEATLARMTEACEANTRPDCPMLAALLQ